MIMSSDPRDLPVVTHGTRLRDSAVNPSPPDFLPPVNAGLEGEEGNPHGPNVYAPGVHASNQFRHVRPGEVGGDPSTQSVAESDHATEHLSPTEAPVDPDPESAG